MDLEGKVAIITGSSRGIGAEVAKLLAQNGADIVLNYPFDGEKDNVLQVKEEIENLGQKAIHIKADVSEKTDAEKLIKKAREEYNKFDILVNNAGITRDNLLLRMKEKDWDQVMDVNLKGVFNCTKAAIRTLMKQRGGRIINLASVVGIIGNAGQANYSASKAGVIGFTKSMARELASRNITVNAVAPGFIKSKMTEELSDKVKTEMQDSIPLNKFGEPQDVAEMIVFLASNKAKYITGQVINIDGGMVM
ncbi:MAG: 3-oxoacyl-[acyl-carrier-protein] reductase [Halanaerobiaceae bacterium]